MQRSRIVPHEVRSQMELTGADIILMQEPYTMKGNIPVSGTSVAIVCRGDKSAPPLAAVGIRGNSISALEIASLCTRHCACVQISDGDTEVYAVSQYFPPSENIEVGIAQLDKVLTYLRGKRVIVGADANAKVEHNVLKKCGARKSIEWLCTLQKSKLPYPDVTNRNIKARNRTKASVLRTLPLAFPEPSWEY
ncbi:hypothetical protein WN48_07213 [Eufriesea mexicana]|uniref:Endonuclease/exonuclease/phosphatase domain-containing protein n=1 Tax=Eufriesea mexicana TaxID=516756 RepID=A0A310SR61_9HYME|nr:hypothetical protein WN48_07213 [Eufriesea mexicana]